ncbi:hypothetical protein OG912_38375 (plasmid) [Streptomyces sp. NBC_00464]|uniref:hypothetical protein n=1 Tax=Streptomyces sp. NBC_00464 TaxID=2975751 RepID=UPI002E19CCCB
MSVIRRVWSKATAASRAWSRVCTDPVQLDILLAAQPATANRQAADHAALAGEMNIDALHVQPGLMDTRCRILADVHYLEGLLIGARSRHLDPELIERLAAAVDAGHELTVLLADAARATAAAHQAGY